MPDSSAPPYINPLIYNMIGSLTALDEFPSEDYVLEIYAQLRVLPAEDVAYMITNDDHFASYINTSLVRAAIRGMDIRGIGFVVTTFIDRNFPGLMRHINSSESDFLLYKNVLTILLSEIRGENVPEQEDEAKGQVEIEGSSIQS
jgi:hypothetical protein